MIDRRSFSDAIAMDGLLARKAQAIWQGLQKYRGQGLGDAEINHLFASYVFGLTMPLCGERPLEKHLEACRALLATALDTAAVEQVLHAVPVVGNSSFEAARARLEERGRCDGEVLKSEFPTAGQKPCDARPNTGRD